MSYPKTHQLNRLRKIKAQEGPVFARRVCEKKKAMERSLRRKVTYREARRAVYAEDNKPFEEIPLDWLESP